jgi:hypothetical protein
MRQATAVVLLCLLWSSTARAQGVDGYASTMLDLVQERSTMEWRSRVFAERRFVIGERVRFTAAGFAEGLIADRAGAVKAAVLRPQELHAEFLWARADVRIGFSRVVWGRLDELLPTDVVNPLDLTRFFFEGRSEARLPVAMVRARLVPSERAAVEAIYVPVFRRGRFDQLDERTSPFNLVAGLPVEANTPPRRWRNGQGGVRASFTTGRVDWAVSSYRGITPFPDYEVSTFGVQERFERFTMIGADVETVRGEWGIRGEVAARRGLQEGGVGVDRRAGASRLSGTVVVSRTRQEADVSLVAVFDRAFARETRQLRVFSVYTPTDGSMFARAIVSVSLADNVSLETSGGLFAGEGTATLSRFATRDFAYARLKVFF